MIRDKNIDILKCIGIISVIIGHSAESEPLIRAIYLWHMPLFFILSGYLYKAKPKVEYIKKSGRHIIIPYFIICSIIILLGIALCIFDGVDRTTYLIPGAIFGTSRALYGTNQLFATGYIHALWFLPALFMCQVMYNTFKTNSDLYNLLIGGWLAILAINLCAKYGHLPFGILQGMCAFIFFHIGYMISKRNLFDCINRYIILAIGIPSIVVSFRSGLLGFSGCKFPNFCINLLGAVCSVIMLYRFVKRYVNIAFVEKIGQISMLILCIHAADALLAISNRIEYFLPYLELPSWINLRMISSLVIAIGGGILFSRIEVIRRFMSIKNGKDKSEAVILQITE